MANHSPSWIRKNISGPVFPLVTPFDVRGDIDYPALHSYINFLTACNAETIMTTVGTSRFNLLTNEEICAVNETLASATTSDIVSIAAGPMTGSLETNIEFAKHAESSGLDAYIVYYPERWYGSQAVFDFFRKIASSVSIAVMIHELPMRNGYGGQIQYPLDLLEQLMTIPNIVGMKEECMDAGYSYQLHRRLHDNCAIIGAGAMRNFMRDYHAGARANLVGIGSFFPRVEMAFQKAFKSGDIDRAHNIVRDYEDPYFDVAVKLGWHPQLKETMSLLGLMPKYERAPLSCLDKVQSRILRDSIEKMGWLNLSPDHIPH